MEFALARFRLEISPPSSIEVDDAEWVNAIDAFVNSGFNRLVGGTLKLHLDLDRGTRRIRSSLLASSVADLLRIQVAMAIAADTTHRQCQECPKWFSVHPRLGRPEKIFCSDACRMRAYRKRLGRAKHPEMRSLQKIGVAK